MASKQTSNSKTKSQVTAGVDARIDPHLQNISRRTDDALNAQNTSDWSGGRIVAGRNSYDDMGIDQMMRTLQGNQFDPGTFTNIARKAASGEMLDPATNPYLEGNITAATRPVMEQMNTMLANDDLGAIGQNAWGGDRAGLTAGVTRAKTLESVGDIRAKMLSDNYNRERQYQWESPEKFLSGLNTELAPGQILQQLGGYERGLQELDPRNELAIRDYNNNIKFSGLPQAAQIQTNVAGHYGTSNSTGESSNTQKTTPNPITEAAKIGLGIASAASGFPMGMGGGGGAPQFSMGTQQLPMPSPAALAPPMPQPIYVPGMGMIQPRSPYNY